MNIPSILRPFSGVRLQRFGCDHDGGYVLPSDCLERIDGLLSFGVDRNWSFERQVRERRPMIPLHAYDPSVSERLFYREKRAAFVRFLTLGGSFLNFQEASRTLDEFRNTFSLPARHFRERAHDHSLGKGDCDMGKAFSRLSGCKNLLVKMDIEGAEDEVFTNISKDSLVKIRYLAIEYHDNIVPNTLKLITEKLFETHTVVVNPSPVGCGMLYASRK
jgi:hypothetical protein